MDRLERIEEKLDKLAEAVVSLARVEEKIVSLEIRRQEMSNQIDELETIQGGHEKRLSSLEAPGRFLEKLFWLVLPLVIGFFIGTL